MPAPDGNSPGTPAHHPQPEAASDFGSPPIPAELVDALPPPFQEAIRQADGDPAAISIITAAFSAYRGPLPPASEIRAYEEILPGSADRILRMAEDQAHHRQGLEKTAVDGGSRRSWWGLFLGFGISVIVIAASVLLVLKGHTVAGTVLGSADLVTLATVFVIGQSGQRRERIKKDAGSHLPAPVLTPDSH